MSTTNNNGLVQSYKGIARKLITRTILFSSAITLIITAFNLYERYNFDISLIDSRFDQISNVHLSSLNNNLWLADKPELLVHLNGILKIPDIQYLEVYNEDKLWASAGTKKNKNVKPRNYNMIYLYKGKELNIGTLKVEADLEHVYQNIYEELWLTLGTNGAKTFLVAFFMFFLFHNLVIRHLHKIAEGVNQFDIKEPDSKLKLDRRDNPANNKDEFDLVLNAFDKLQKDLRLSFSSIEDQVKHRTKELVAAKEKAINSDSEKSKFLSRMSHELRTPMNAVLGFAQLLSLDESTTPLQRDNIDEILTAGNHLLELINQVLDLSRIESGDLSLELSPIAIHIVINESISLVQPLLDEQKIQLIFDSEIQKNWIVLGESFHLKQVFINLLSNAIKYNVQNGKITIKAEVHKDHLRINIIDTGLGLSPEQQQIIFEPFNRAGAETTSIEGTGIGLTISKRFMELMDGNIGVKSNVGDGCCFFIDLKLIKDEHT